MVTEKVKAFKVTLDPRGYSMSEEEVAVEASIRIHIDNRHIATLMASPTMLRELAVGYIFSEGILKNRDAMENITVEGDEVHVWLKEDARPDIVDLERGGSGRVIESACGSTIGYANNIPRHDVKVYSEYSISAEDILRAVSELNVNSRNFKATGGLHSAALFEDGAMVSFSEDVGRHNAVDKVIGSSIMKGVRFERSLIVTSGRQTGDMVAKAARIGIPISISVSAPLYSGIKIAEEAGVTLICFARGKRFNIYTGHERVRLD